jgi:hypothetical protein
MRRKGILSVTIVIGLVVAGFVVPIVFAKGNPHLKIRTMGWAVYSMYADGDIAGAASETVYVRLDAEGFADAMCRSRGGNEAPGRNPISVTTDSWDFFTTDEHGRASFALEAPDPTTADVEPSPTPKEAGCPNGNWTVYFVPLSTDWRAATISLFATDDKQNPVGDPLEVTHFTCVTTFEDHTAVDVECTPVK